MSSPTAPLPTRAVHLLLRPGLHIVGLVATSYWLVFAVQHTPGFAESQLASTLGPTSATRASGFVHTFVHQALLPGVLEELLFRGMLFAVLVRLRGTGFAVVATALLFGIFHLDLHHAAVATLLGLQLGLLRAVHGLLLCTIAHVTNNSLALVTAGLAAGPASRLDPAATTAATPWLFVALAVSALSCAHLVQAMRKASTPAAPPRSDLQACSLLDD